MGWTNVRDLGVIPLQNGEWAALIPVVLGALLFARFIPKLGWLSRYSLAYLVGVAAAVTITGVIDAGIISQVRAPSSPLTDLNSAFTLLANVTAISVFFFIVGSRGENGSVLGNKLFQNTIEKEALWSDGSS